MAWRLAPTKPKVDTAPPPTAATAQASALPSVARNFYLEHPAVAALSRDQADALRATLDISVLGAHAADCPNPVSTFLQASFPRYLLDALSAAGFSAPTPIQRQSWPVAMKGLDMVGCAQTGSGKTLAYLLPALVHVNAQPVSQPGDGPIVLVLAPTRELSAQIHEEGVRFGQPCGVRSALVVGGVPKGPQVLALRKAPEIVVATPGRLTDLLGAKRTELTHCTYLVLDEADRMLDLGFEPQIRQLLHQMRADRQTLLFSATWPVEVQALAARHLLPDAITVEVGGALAAGGRANVRIDQHVSVCEESGKLAALVGILEERMGDALESGDAAPRLMVFCSSKKRCEDVTRALRVDGWPALGIHGDKPQEERDWVLHEFKSGASPLLVATDVAQRGLDIAGVGLVINFDCPSSGEAYVHRIGRSGRAGCAGSAHTLLTQEDARVGREILQVIQRARQSVPAALEALATAAPPDAKRHKARA